MIIAMLMAHLVGDFLLQNDTIARWKSRELKGVLVHGTIVLAVTLVFALAFDTTWWPWALFVGLTHTLVDAIPLWLTRRMSQPGTGTFVLTRLLDRYVRFYLTRVERVMKDFHYYRRHYDLKELAEECRKAASQTQLMVTTHSPFFVNALRPEELWVLYRDEKGFTQAKRAADMTGVKDFVKAGAKLGQLWVEGHFEFGDPLVQSGGPKTPATNGNRQG